MAGLIVSALVPGANQKPAPKLAVANQPSGYRFGEFRLCLGERQLWRQNEPVTLTPRALDLLIALVQASGRVVERSELLRQVWRGVNVHDSNLTVNLCLLRRALGSGQRLIVTVPCRGYQFVAPVEDLRPAVAPLRNAAETWLMVAPVQQVGHVHHQRELATALGPALVVAMARVPGLKVRSDSADTVSVVNWRLEACYQELGSRLRVTAQLIRIRDGGVEWAASRQFPAASTFALQDRIAAWLRTMVGRAVA